MKLKTKIRRSQNSLSDDADTLGLEISDCSALTSSDLEGPTGCDRFSQEDFGDPVDEFFGTPRGESCLSPETLSLLTERLSLNDEAELPKKVTK